VVEAAGAHFDEVVAQILERDFAIKKPPEVRVCKECDFRIFCSREGTIMLQGEGV